MSILRPFSTQLGGAGRTFAYGSSTRHFSTHRLARYCLDAAELLDTERVVPVVIFLKPGYYPRALCLGTARKTYLGFEFVTCDLGTIPAMEYIHSRNIVARINLPNMRQEPGQRVEIYLRAQEGLAELEPDPNKRVKYIDFIARYANLSESEQAQYERYLQQSSYREAIMGPVQQAREEGIRQGVQQGVQQGMQQGMQEGMQQGMQRGMQQGMQRGMQQGEHKKAAEMARVLLDEGVAIDIISRSSGLSEEEIGKLSLH